MRTSSEGGRKKRSHDECGDENKVRAHIYLNFFFFHLLFKIHGIIIVHNKSDVHKITHSHRAELCLYDGRASGGRNNKLLCIF